MSEDFPDVGSAGRKKKRKKKQQTDFVNFAGSGMKFRVVKDRRRRRRPGAPQNQTSPQQVAEDVQPEPVFVRRECRCQATLHKFWANCTECGYIFCDVERDGQCFTCGAVVIQGQGTIPASDAQDEKTSAALEKARKIAVEHRDKLLRYNKEREQRTKVRSDEFWEDEANNLYITADERKVAKEMAEQVRAKKLESRAKKGYKINLDLKGRTITDVHEEEELSTLKTYKEMQEANERLAKQKWREKPTEKRRTVRDENTKSFFENTALTGHAMEVYERLKQLLNDDPAMKKSKKGGEKRGGRFVGDLSDGEPDEEETAQKPVSGEQRKPKLLKDKGNETLGGDDNDKGVCLSMHQPWASLLVHGIKQVEGRTWSTEYRGRLWIAAAKRIPTDFEIEEVEDQYCKVYGLSRAEVPFPDYPTACLLGAVDLVGVKTHDEYEETRTTLEQNSSDHVFMCRNPRALILPGQCSGEHKLWRIPPDKVKLFQGGLRIVDVSWYPTGTEPPEEKTDA